MTDNDHTTRHNEALFQNTRQKNAKRLRAEQSDISKLPDHDSSNNKNTTEKVYPTNSKKSV